VPQWGQYPGWSLDRAWSVAKRRRANTSMGIGRIGCTKGEDASWSTTLHGVVERRMQLRRTSAWPVRVASVSGTGRANRKLTQFRVHGGSGCLLLTTSMSEGKVNRGAVATKVSDVLANAPLGTGRGLTHQNSDLNAPNPVMRRQKRQKRECARKFHVPSNCELGPFHQVPNLGCWSRLTAR